MDLRIFSRLDEIEAEVKAIHKALFSPTVPVVPQVERPVMRPYYHAHRGYTMVPDEQMEEARYNERLIKNLRLESSGIKKSNIKLAAANQALARNLEEARNEIDRLQHIQHEQARIIRYERREKCKAQDALKKGYRGRVAELQADNERKEQVIQRQIGYIEQYKRRLAVTDLSREDCSAWCPGCPACKR